jgi:hypothetical protein
MDRTTIGARSDHPAPESLQSIFFLQSEIATKIFDGPVNTSEMPMTISLISNKEQKSSENKFFKIRRHCLQPRS